MRTTHIEANPRTEPGPPASCTPPLPAAPEPGREQIQTEGFGLWFGSDVGLNFESLGLE